MQRLGSLFKSSTYMVPKQMLKEFDLEITELNFHRMKIFSFVVLLLCGPLLYIDFQSRQKGLWSHSQGYKYLFFFHLILGAGLLVLYILAVTGKSKAKEGGLWHKLLSISFYSFMIFICTGVSVIDQLIHGEITVYVIAVFGLAFAMFFSNTVTIFVYSIAFLSMIAGIGFLQDNPDRALANYINATIVTLVAWVLSRLIFSSKAQDFLNRKTIEQQKGEIEETKNKLEDLLKNILPEPVVARIKAAGHQLPEMNPCVTIVFADLVSFSEIAEKSDSKKLLDTLEDVFRGFDGIIRRYRLEKLKTIGDGYMFAGGLFDDSDQLMESVDATIDIAYYLKSREAELMGLTGFRWAVRIGVHTGPAITGIIGKWRVIYDVWGPTVNVASALEASSMPNRINISQTVFEKLRNNPKYCFEPNGMLSLKKLKPVDMYFVDRKGQDQSSFC